MATEQQGTSSSPSPSVAAPAPTHMVDRVSLKVPPFWPNEPALWFAQLDSQFAISGIVNDNTKYNIVVANLDFNQVQLVRDLIAQPPTANQYGTIKQELIQRLSASQHQKIHQLLQQEEMGDRKPSEYLRKLQSLAPTSLPEDFLRTLWTGRLPQQIQTILTTQEGMSLDNLAKLADKVHEVCTPSLACTVSSVDSDIHKQLAEIVKRLDRLETKSCCHRQSRSRSRTSERTTTNRASNQSTLCYYHSRFGDKAKKCNSPCSFTLSENSRGENQ